MCIPPRVLVVLLVVVVVEVFLSTLTVSLVELGPILQQVRFKRIRSSSSSSDDDDDMYTPEGDRSFVGSSGGHSLPL